MIIPIILLVIGILLIIVSWVSKDKVLSNKLYGQGINLVVLDLLFGFLIYGTSCTSRTQQVEIPRSQYEYFQTKTGILLFNPHEQAFTEDYRCKLNPERAILVKNISYNQYGYQMTEKEKYTVEFK